MARLRIARAAQCDLDEIRDFIARDRPIAADQWLDRTCEKFVFLAANPLAGQARDELRRGLRSVSHKNYVIYFRYLVEQDAVEVVRVLHGARDITQFEF